MVFTGEHGLSYSMLKRGFVHNKKLSRKKAFDSFVLGFVLATAIWFGATYFAVTPLLDFVEEERDWGARTIQWQTLPTGEQTSGVGGAAVSSPISLIKKYFPKEEHDNAIAVMQCESSGRADAIGDGHLNPKSYGLFQIRAFEGRPSPEDLLNPEKNVIFAAELWEKEGWKPWTCGKNLV